MKKIIKSVGILVIALSLMLTGCAKMECNMELKSNGTIYCEIVELFKESFMLDIDPDWSVDKISEDSNNSGLKDYFVDMKSDAISEVIDGENWAGVKYSGTLTEDQFNKVVTKEGNKYTISIHVGGAENVNILDIFSVYGMNGVFSQPEASGASVTTKLTMPGKITCNVENEGIVIDNKTATIDYSKLGDVGTVTFTCDAYNIFEKYFLIPVIVVATAAVGAIIAAIVFKKKKKNNTPEEAAE